MRPGLEVWAPDGVPEVRPGDDLVALVLDAVPLVDGDVLVVTSKVVSKAEGRLRDGDREGALAEETTRVVARRGPTTIVRTHHGLTLAAAGIDASNVEPGTIALLPRDPDASARRLRAGLRERGGVVVGVVVTDTAGRAWREGQTDLAIGCAGMPVLDDHAGRLDLHGNRLAVTAPALADEVAGAADLVRGKLGGRPFARLRGLGLVLPAEDDGPGAAALVRPASADLFGYGAREAVVRAALRDPADRVGFGAPAGSAELLEVIDRVLGTGHAVPDGAGLLTTESAAGGPAAVLGVLAFAHGWEPDPHAQPTGSRWRPAGP